MSEETKPESTNVISVDFAVLSAFRELYEKYGPQPEDRPELMWSAETEVGIEFFRVRPGSRLGN